MRYVEARIEEYNREEAYRIYVTKSLQLIPQNKHLTKGYIDVLNSQDDEEDNRDGDDIAIDIMTRAGLRFEG